MMGVAHIMRSRALIAAIAFGAFQCLDAQEDGPWATPEDLSVCIQQLEAERLRDCARIEELERQIAEAQAQCEDNSQTLERLLTKKAAEVPAPEVAAVTPVAADAALAAAPTWMQQPQPPQATVPEQIE